MVEWIFEERQRKGEFICMTGFLDDNGKLPRDWAPGHVFITNICGVRSHVLGDFVSDETVQTKLGDLPEVSPSIQRASLMNDKLEPEWGVVVPRGSLPKDVPCRPVETYVESQTSWVSYKLQHSESLRAGHAEDAMKFQLAVDRRPRPNAMTFTGKPQTWADILALMDKVQEQWKAAVRAREAARSGHSAPAAVAPVTASRLAGSSSSHGPSGPTMAGGGGRGGRAGSAAPKHSMARPSPAPRAASAAPAAVPPRAPQKTTAAGGGQPSARGAAGSNTPSPQKPGVGRRTVAPEGNSSSPEGEDEGKKRTREVQISFEELTVDVVLTGYNPMRQVNPVVGSASSSLRSHNPPVVASGMAYTWHGMA